MVCYIMIPIYNPTWKLPRTAKARSTRGTSTQRRRRRRRQGLQEPTVHSARLHSHWQRVRLYWDASMSLLAWPKFYSSYKRRARRSGTKAAILTLSYLIILPVDRPWAQRYRGNDPCHLSTGDKPIRKFKYYPQGVRNAKRTVK
jgi:hypothetical protein